MTQLGQEAVRVAELQGKLLQKLDMLEAHQGDIHKTLDDMENEAGKLFEEEEPFRDPVDSKRIMLYNRAVAVSEQLSQCAPIALPSLTCSGFG
jgi:hypothetical protein